jgi:hypothetical protein
MPRPKRPAPARGQPGSSTELRRSLTKRTKSELVDVLMELAQADRGVLRQLTARFDVATTPDELVAAARQSIADATAFDEREINRKFDYDYDYEAYAEVKRNLGRLIASGRLRPTMPLALELMKQGSYQVEMSDEGLIVLLQLQWDNRAARMSYNLERSPSHAQENPETFHRPGEGRHSAASPPQTHSHLGPL